MVLGGLRRIASLSAPLVVALIALALQFPEAVDSRRALLADDAHEDEPVHKDVHVPEDHREKDDVKVM